MVTHVKFEPMTIEERIDIAKRAISEALGKDIDNFRHEVVGSTYIKGSDKSDVDMLILYPTRRTKGYSVNWGAGDLDKLWFDGWTYGGSVGMGNDNWMSWKRTVDGVEVNMLLVDEQPYFDSWLAASEVCRFLHLQGYDIKTGTVHGIHEIIMDDSTAEVENNFRSY